MNLKVECQIGRPTLILAFLCLCAIQVYAKDVQCWRCHNGYKPSKTCEQGPTKESSDTGNGVEPDVKIVYFMDKEPSSSSAVNTTDIPSGSDDETSQAPHRAHHKTTEDCKSLPDFFLKYSIVTAEWTKRNMPRSRGRTVTQEEGFCTTVMVWATNHASSALVYRDCVKGTREEVKDGIEVNLEVRGFTFNGGSGDIDECKEKEVGSERGTKRVRVCICNKDKCNNQGSSAFVYIPNGFSILSAMLFTLIVTYGSSQI